MDKQPANWAQINDTLEALRQQVGQLNQRVAALEATAEGQATKAEGPDTSRAPRASAATEGLSEELILVLGAAVAAFLGKRAPIRQIRLLGSAAWAQQGRATIQASHNR